MDQPGKVANPARGQLNRENSIPLSPRVPENLVSRDGFSRPVPRQSAHLHPQAESGAYLRDSSRVPRWRPLMTEYSIMFIVRLFSFRISFFYLVTTGWILTSAYYSTVSVRIQPIMLFIFMLIKYY